MASAGVTYRAITSVVPMDRVDTPELFKNCPVRKVSPLDLFVENTQKINKLYTSQIWDENNWYPEFGSLMLLGYMSAVESYFRAVVTGLINFDEATRRRAGPKQLTFGVAINHPDPKLLPEVLLEHTSFTSSKYVKNVLNDFLGLRENEFPNDVSSALKEFDKICHVRHCCVHRFGKLGTHNAWQLGFQQHRAMIERPFSPTIDEVRAISGALVTFVRTINNFLFYSMLDRTVFDGLDEEISWRWSWNYAADRLRFKKYYDFFASITAIPKSEPIRDVYDDFKAQHAAMIAKRAIKGA